jgi:nuclear transport factor 2 (NTF2) superfamily protein
MTASPFASMLSAVYETHDIASMREAYLHRGVRNHGGQRHFGRDAIINETLDDFRGLGSARFSIENDLGTFVGTRWAHEDGTFTRRHYWPVFEDGLVAQETIVDNASYRPAPVRTHCLLGELDAGRGQLGPKALQGFSHSARMLDQLWNGRDLSVLTKAYHEDATYQGPKNAGDRDKLKAWRLAQLTDYPHAHLVFEREVQIGDHIALLWQWSRISKSGVHDRVTGSTLLTLKDHKIAHEETLIDKG